MVKKVATKDLMSLLESSVETFWVCPVTGKKIASSDARAIAAHKKETLAKLAEQAEKELKSEELKNCLAKSRKEIADATRLSQVSVSIVSWLRQNGVSSQQCKKVSVSPLPRGYSVHDEPYVVISGVGKNKTLLKKLVGEDCRWAIPMTRTKGAQVKSVDYIALLSSRSFLGNALSDHYSRSRHRVAKLSEEDKLELRRSNQEYARGVERQKVLANEIHALRAEYATIEKTLDGFRKTVLASYDFGFM